MSEPLRYLAKCPWYSIELQAHPRGEFVLYSENARLKAEVERLTKAGDAMAFHYHQLELRVGNYSFSVKAPSIQAWEKAKEVQS